MAYFFFPFGIEIVGIRYCIVCQTPLFAIKMIQKLYVVFPKLVSCSLSILVCFKIYELKKGIIILILSLFLGPTRNKSSNPGFEMCNGSFAKK